MPTLFPEADKAQNEAIPSPRTTQTAARAGMAIISKIRSPKRRHFRRKALVKQTFTGRPKNLNTKEDPEIYPKAVRNTTSHANVRSRDCLTSGHRQEADPQHLKMQQQIDELNNNISLLQEENERITIENKKLVSIDTVDDIQK